MRRLLVTSALALSCGAPPPPFTPPIVEGPPAELECSLHSADFADYIIGVPVIVRVTHRWNHNWCVNFREDFRGFMGSWYFTEWSSNFTEWSTLNRVILRVDGRPLAWYVDGESGFDPGFDVAPYLSIHDPLASVETSRSRVCIPVEVDLDAWTSQTRTDFTYHLGFKVCPADGWNITEEQDGN